jgi:hypothetical protein
MPDTAISGLGAAAALADADLCEVVQAAAPTLNKKATLRQVARYIGDSLHNEQFATPAQAPAASATTYLNNSAITIPTGETVPANAWFRWNFHLTKTAAGTLANSILVKWGTAGTTADATLLTFTLPAGTAVADDADVEVIVGFRSVGAGTAAVVVGRMRMIHNLSATGWATIPCVVTAGIVSAGFDSTVNLSKIGLAITLAASYVVTVPLLRVEAKNL